MAANQRITIDPAVLARCAVDLTRVAEGLKAASQRVAGSPVDGDAFGRMNSWMVSPIQTVATRSTDLVRTSGDVIGALAVSTRGAAEDFAVAEEAIVKAIRSIESAIEGGQP